MHNATKIRLRAMAAAGIVILAALPAYLGAARAGGPTSVLDPDILAPGASPRAIVGFEHDVKGRTIRRLAAAGINKAVVLDSIDAVGVLGPLASYRSIARWEDVRFVDSDSRLRWLNYQAKKDTHVDEVRGGKAPLNSKYQGAGVTVAVVDTGIEDTHPDLEGRVVKHLNFEPGYFFDMINDGVYSDQLVETTGNPIDSYGHGTHVAGIVAGTGASGGGEDFSGVAPKASLVDFKIADVHEGLVCDVPCDFGWELNALVAYEYLIEHRNDKAYPGGIRVATNSWSIFEVDSEVEPITLIVKEAYKHGIVNVFAAGNDGPDANTVAPGPNSIEEVITVAAACKGADSCGEDKIAEFSSRGPQVDVAAPGDNVYSAIAHASALWPIGTHEPPGDPANGLWYVGFSGTSMATPHVAGIVALMLEADPGLRPAGVERILVRSAVDKGAPGFDNAWGHGLVNAYEAVVRAEK